VVLFFGFSGDALPALLECCAGALAASSAAWQPAYLLHGRGRWSGWGTQISTNAFGSLRVRCAPSQESLTRVPQVSWMGKPA